jgi:hypothetical protein
MNCRRKGGPQSRRKGRSASFKERLRRWEGEALIRPIHLCVYLMYALSILSLMIKEEAAPCPLIALWQRDVDDGGDIERWGGKALAIVAQLCRASLACFR